jgi:hypothetical protein
MSLDLKRSSNSVTHFTNAETEAQGPHKKGQLLMEGT